MDNFFRSIAGIWEVAYGLTVCAGALYLFAWSTGSLIAAIVVGK